MGYEIACERRQVRVWASIGWKDVGGTEVSCSTCAVARIFGPQIPASARLHKPLTLSAPRTLRIGARGDQQWL